MPRFEQWQFWLRRGCGSKGPILCGVLLGLYLATRPRSERVAEAPLVASADAPWKALADNLVETLPRTPKEDAKAAPPAPGWAEVEEPSPTKEAMTTRPAASEHIQAASLQMVPELEPTPDCFEPTRGRSGHDLSQIKASSAAECRKHCQCTEHCSFFTYWEDGNCYAQTEKATEMRAIGVVSGPAYCGIQKKSLLPERAPDLPKLQTVADGYEGPTVYVYELPERFRNGGKEPTCFTADCVFGGPPMMVQGVEIWSSNQFHMPRMVYYRFLTSPRRTRDINEAEVFLVPAYSSTPSPETKCADNDDLFQTLFQLNPALQDPAWAAEKASRHVFVDARGWETCNYLWQTAMPFRMFHRVNIELNGLMEDGPEGWTEAKPFFWYQMPYPSVYHGHAEAIPAKLRRRGFARYLWSFTGTGRGIAGELRGRIKQQCSLCTRCGRVSDIAEVGGEVKQRGDDSYRYIAELKLQSTFCLEPPGDTLTRKSLLDSMALGCIPVVFEHQELDMFEPFLSAEQFAATTLFVPEAEVLGGNVTPSIWAIGTYGGKTKRSINKKIRRLQKLYPEYSGLLEALHPQFSQQERWEQVKRLFPSPTPIFNILTRLSEEEVRNKQEALAQLAHRLVIGLDDSSEDAVRILIDKIVSNDAAAKELAANSPL